MSIAVLVTMALSVLFAATAPALGRRLPPTLATRLLVTGSLAVSASTLFVLAVVAFGDRRAGPLVHGHPASGRSDS